MQKWQEQVDAMHFSLLFDWSAGLMVSKWCHSQIRFQIRYYGLRHFENFGIQSKLTPSGVKKYCFQQTFSHKIKTPLETSAKRKRTSPTIFCSQWFTILALQHLLHLCFSCFFFLSAGWKRLMRDPFSPVLALPCVIVPATPATSLA